MDGMDADMMDAESPAASSPSPSPSLLQPPPPPPAPYLQSNAEQSEVARGLLIMARQLIDQGKPSQALQAVVMATRTKGGDEAVIQSLNRARELYRNKIQASTDTDELASLFAECAIAEADSMPSNSEPSQSNAVNQQPMEPDTRGTSILAETGRKQIMLDAFSDGSSFVCLQCGGLVSNHRREEHYAFWCGNI